MSTDGPGVDAKDGELYEELDRWCNLFKAPWYEAATRPADANAPTVPRVMHAGEEDTDGELAQEDDRLPLQEVLATSATGLDYRLMRYLTTDRTLADLAEVDTTGYKRAPTDENFSFNPGVVTDFPQRTRLEDLVEGDAATVEDTLERTMKNFRIVEMEYAGGSFQEPEPPFEESNLGTDRSKFRNDQYQAFDRALGQLTRGRSRFGADEHADLDVRIGTLVPQDLNTVDASGMGLPLVDDRIDDAIAAIANADYETLRKAGNRLRLEDDGSVSNSFKKPYYETVGGEAWRGNRSPDESEALFTDDATVDNVGDDAYTVYAEDANDDAYFCRFQPEPTLHVNPRIAGVRALPDHPGMGDVPEHIPVWAVYEMKERIARAEKLEALHELGTDSTYGGNPGVMTSLLQHLLRFGRLRTEHTAAARELLLRGELSANPGLDFEYDTDHKRYFLTTHRALLNDPEGHTKLWGRIEGTGVESIQPTIDTPLDVGSVVQQLDDPRHAQFLASLEYLRGLEPDELERLLQQTLDLSSHRLDAWWTSIATRRLAEHRHGQDNWYVLDPAPDHQWYGSTPYLPPSADAPTVPEEYGEDVTRREAAGKRVNPRKLAQTEETRSIQTVIDTMQAMNTEFQRAADSPQHGDFDDSVADTFQQRHDEWVAPANVTEDARRQELDYLTKSLLEDPSGSGTTDFFSRAYTYLDNQDFREVELGSSGHNEIEDYVQELETYVKQGSEPLNDDIWAETPDDRMDDLFAGQFGASSFEDFVHHFVQVFTFAKTAAAAEAANQSDEEPETYEDHQPVSPPSLPRTNDSGIYVGAWGYVENLQADPGLDDPGEYVHAPSMQQATTAAILRGGHEAFRAEKDSHTGAIDLTADRVQITRQLVDGVREGQSLGALLGYRFERALHAVERQEYIHEFREGFPSLTGTLGGEDGSEAAARSDVVDGYALYRALDYDGETIAAGEDYPSSGVPAPDSDSGVERALVYLLEVVDALKDLLTAESVHQFAQGNYSRSKASLEAMAAGDAIPEPEVVETPRTETGFTHRLLVAFGDASANTPQAAGTPDEWRPGTRLTHPTLPGVGDAPEVPEPTRDGAADGYPLQVRNRAEPNLDSWIGDLLPDPATVGFEADFEWAEDRSFAAGMFTTPTEDGRVSVDDVGFEPDVVVFTAATPVASTGRGGSGAGAGDGGGSSADSGSDSGDGQAQDRYGWTHGVLQRTPDDDLDQHSVGTGARLGDADTAGTVDDGRALHVDVPTPGTSGGTDAITGTVVETTEDGFALEVANETDGHVVAVQYRAYASGDRTTVSAGTLLTPASATVESYDLGVDADHVALTTTGVVETTGLSDGASESDAVTGAAGLCHGEVVDDGSLDQRAVALSRDPATDGGPTVATHGGAALHLPNEIEATATGLDSTLDLDFASVPSGERRVLSYVAVATADGESPPKLGVADAGRTALATSGEEFSPACVEFLALPAPQGGMGSGGTTETLAAGGWSHGVVTETGRQRVLSASTDGAVRGEGAVDAVAIGTVPDGNGGTTEVRASVDGIDDTGFSLDFDGAAEDLLVLYRAWPSAPREREHKVPARGTLADLALSPTDALTFPKAEEEGGQTALEQRIAYALRRDRSAAIPDAATPHAPIPDDATVDLQLRDAGDGDMSLAELLELLRAIRETVEEGRPAEADDVVPPAERGGTGYDQGTYDALSRRAEPAHAALADVAGQLENRLSLLASEDDDPTVTEQVAEIEDALETFRASVAGSGVREAVSRIRSATVEDDGVLESELEAIRSGIPAGPTTRGDVDVEHAVGRLTGQRIAASTSASNAAVTVRAMAATSADAFVRPDGSRAFERRSTTTTDADGTFEALLDFQDAPPGAAFVVVATEGSRVVHVGDCRVVEQTGSPVVEPDGTATIRGQTTLDADTTVSLQIDTVVDDAASHDTVSRTESTTVEAGGRIAADVDLGTVEPRTTVTVVGTTSDGTEVLRSRGYVRDPDAERRLDDRCADLPVLSRLLWLSREMGELDPATNDSAAATLQATLGADGIDWPAITGEVDLAGDWAGRPTGRSRTDVDPRIDQEAADAVGVLKDCETLSLGQLAGQAWTALGPVESTVADAIDVAGGTDRVEDATFWLAAGSDTQRTARTALANLLHNPAARDHLDPESLQVAPAFAAFAGIDPSGAASGPFPDYLERRLGRYLTGWFDASAWVVDELLGDVSRPDQFLQRLRTLVYQPDTFVADGLRSDLESDLAAVVSYFDTGAAFDELTAASTAAETLADSAPQGTGVPAELIAVQDGLQDMTDRRTSAGLAEDLETAQSGFDALQQGGAPNWMASDDVDALDEALQTLAKRVNGERPVTRIDRLDRTAFGFEDGQYHAVDGSASDQATPATEFVHFLDLLSDELQEFETAMSWSQAPYDAAGARSGFANWWDSATDTLATRTETELGPIVGAGDQRDLAATFRHCVLESLRAPLLRSAYFGVYGAVPATPVGDDPSTEAQLVGQARGVRDRLRERLGTATQHANAADDLLDDADPAPAAYADAAEHELQRLEALFGDGTVVLPPLSPANQAELSATFAPGHQQTLLSAADPLETETWLQRTARVRERPDLFREALTYAELVGGELLREDLRVGQLPVEPDDDWVGIDGVEPQRGTTSLVAQFASEYRSAGDAGAGEDPLPIAASPGTGGGSGAQVAGLLVDEWRVSAPATEETTGVALNYDDPSTEPPQSVLLAVPPDAGDEPWDDETLIRTILEAVDVAKLRGVDLKALGKPEDNEHRLLGHYLPAMTLPLDTYDVANIPSVDLDLDVELADAMFGEDGGEGS